MKATVRSKKVIAATTEATDDHADRDFRSKGSGLPTDGSG
jgi:hypothetical protein